MAKSNVSPDVILFFYQYSSSYPDIYFESTAIVIGRAGSNVESLLRQTGLSKIFVRVDESSGNPYVEVVGCSWQVAESGAYAILDIVQEVMKRRISDAYVTNGQFRTSAEFV